MSEVGVEGAAVDVVECGSCGGECPAGLAQRVSDGPPHPVCPFCEATSTLVVPGLGSEAVLRGVARMLCANACVQVGLALARADHEDQPPAPGMDDPPGPLVDLRPTVRERVDEVLRQHALVLGVDRRDVDHTGDPQYQRLAVALTSMVHRAISDAVDAPLRLWPPAPEVGGHT